jgi:chemotaxis protein CheC
VVGAQWLWASLWQGHVGLIEKLDALQLSAVHEVANIGLGNAATALASLTSLPITIEVPAVKASPATDLVMSDEDAEVTVGVFMAFTGDVEGHLAFFFPWHGACCLWNALLACAPSDPSEIDELFASAIVEVGNVVCSGFLNAVSDMTDLRLHATPPMMGVDLLQALVAEITLEAELSNHVALTIETSFGIDGGETLGGRCLIVPHPEGLCHLLWALGLEVAA